MDQIYIRAHYINTAVPHMSDLYIMERSDALGMVKIGSSSNPERRRCKLQECHTFTMKLLAVFPGKGYLEQKVHCRLSHMRVWTGTGREFYSLAPTGAFNAVSEVVFDDAATPRFDMGPALVLPQDASLGSGVRAPSWLEGLKFNPARSHIGS